MDTSCKYEVWVRQGWMWNSYPFGYNPYRSDETPFILRIFAAPGPNIFRIGPSPFGQNKDFTIMIRDQMITPVRVSVAREHIPAQAVTFIMTVTSEEAVPMKGKVDHDGREIRTMQDSTPPPVR